MAPDLRSNWRVRRAIAIRPTNCSRFKTTGLRQHQLYLLQAVPEIGGSKAKLLLETFGSPAEIARASVDELRTVEGIGEVAATKIYRVFHHVGREE